MIHHRGLGGHDADVEGEVADVRLEPIRVELVNQRVHRIGGRERRGLEGHGGEDSGGCGRGAEDVEVEVGSEEHAVKKRSLRIAFLTER